MSSVWSGQLEEVRGAAVPVGPESGDRPQPPRVDAALRVQYIVVDMDEYDLADDEVRSDRAVAEAADLEQATFEMHRRLGHTRRRHFHRRHERQARERGLVPACGKLARG